MCCHWQPPHLSATMQLGRMRDREAWRIWCNLPKACWGLTRTRRARMRSPTTVSGTNTTRSRVRPTPSPSSVRSVIVTSTNSPCCHSGDVGYWILDFGLAIPLLTCSPAPLLTCSPAHLLNKLPLPSFVSHSIVKLQIDIHPTSNNHECS